MKHLNGRPALTPFQIMDLVDEFRHDISCVGHAPTQFVMARRYAKDLAEEHYTRAIQELAADEQLQQRRERW